MKHECGKIEKNVKKKPLFEKRNCHLNDIFYLTRPESTQDCTGYTPVMPLSAEESESYEDLMDLPAPKISGRYSEEDYE